MLRDNTPNKLKDVSPRKMLRVLNKYDERQVDNAALEFHVHKNSVYRYLRQYRIRRVLRARYVIEAVPDAS